MIIEGNEKYYAKKILIKICETHILNGNDKLTKVLLRDYMTTLYRQCPDLDVDMIYKLCISYLKEHNYL